MATFLNDTFTGTNGATLESRTGETGATWTKHGFTGFAGTLSIQANRLYQSASTAGYYASGVPGTAEYDVEGPLYAVTAAGGVGLMARVATAANNAYMAYYASGNWQLFKLVAGTWTQLSTSYAQTLTAGQTYTLKLEIRNATKKLFINGVERISSTDNAITDTGRAGVYGGAAHSSTTGLHLDSVTGNDLAVVNLSGAAAISAPGVVTATATTSRSGSAAISAPGSVTSTGAPYAVITHSGAASISAAGMITAFGGRSLLDISPSLFGVAETIDYGVVNTATI